MIFSLRRWAMFIKNTQNEKLNKSFATDFSNNLILTFIGSVLNKNPNFIRTRKGILNPNTLTMEEGNSTESVRDQNEIQKLFKNL